MNEFVQCPRCKDWRTDPRRLGLSGERTTAIVTCYLCGGTKCITAELDAAYRLLLEKNEGIPGPNWASIKTLYQTTDLLSPQARRTIRPYLEPEERMMAAITNEGVVFSINPSPVEVKCLNS